MSLLIRPKGMGSGRAKLGRDADMVRSRCKRCKSALLNGQPAVWGTGELIGLIHVNCDHPDGVPVPDEAVAA